MKTFTCRICGETYIGREVPGSCPFCGVANKFLVLASVWKDENNIELSDVSRRNLEEAIKIELSNVYFYKCVAKIISDIGVAKMFKGLAKVEAEHAEVFQKLLKLDSLPKVDEICEDNIEESVSESLVRERRAVKFYAKALVEASEPRIREVFEAIMNVEKDHVALDEEMSEKLNK